MLFRKLLNKRHWDEREWLKPGDVQADSLGSLGTKDNDDITRRSNNLIPMSRFLHHVRVRHQTGMIRGWFPTRFGNGRNHIPRRGFNIIAQGQRRSRATLGLVIRIRREP